MVHAFTLQPRRDVGVVAAYGALAIRLAPGAMNSCS
jgi:hypothetical protein